jgi:putative acetyltransferase
MIIVREERSEDIEAVRMVNETAFGQPAEANIVDKLRENCRDLLSLVAVQNGAVMGHILFSPARIEGERKTMRGMGLAPMAVLPAWQRQGIGTHLIQKGIEILKDRGCPFVIALGHPGYYPRFGFERASRYGIRSQWDGVPDEAFMISILDLAALRGLTGVARYRDEFDEAM